MDREEYIEETTNAARGLLTSLLVAGQADETLDAAVDAVIDAVWEDDTERIDAALDAMVQAYNAHRAPGETQMPGREAITS